MSKGIPFDPGLKQLLLVAGLAGSGKSTLINQLKRGTLAPEIRDALPSGANQWPIVTGRRPSKWERLRSRKSGPPSGQILHCDITRAFFANVISARTRDFAENDPVFRQQLSAADEIIAVLVTTPKEQLMQQVAARSFLLHLPPIARSLAAPFVPQLIRLEGALPKFLSSGVAGKLGRRWRHRSELRAAHSNLVHQYEGADDLQRMYRQWSNWLTSACSRRPQLLYVEPHPGMNGDRKFRLIRPANLGIADS